MENLFIKGGIFMWPLLGLLVVTMIIVIERLLYWFKTKLENNKHLKQVLVGSEDNSVTLERIKENRSDPALSVAYLGLLNEKLTEVEIDNFIKQQQLYHGRFMRLLDLTISVAPLLGILGTIWGIISSFNLAGAVKEIDPSTAMLGISEAFITTAFGLIVSLIALFAYSYFQSLSENELIANDIFLTEMMVKIKSNG